MEEDPIAILAARRSADQLPNSARLWPFIIVALILLAIAVSIFGTQVVPSVVPDASSTVTHQVRTYTVSYRAGVFSPTNLRIHAGDTVQFRNDGGSSVRVVAQVLPGAKTSEFNTGLLAPGGQFLHIFATVGVFAYANDSDTTQAGVIIVR